MKQSTPIFKILAACVLSGVLLVLGIQIWQTASDPTAVARVYKAKTEETIAADGWVIRWEKVPDFQSALQKATEILTALGLS